MSQSPKNILQLHDESTWNILDLGQEQSAWSRTAEGAIIQATETTGKDPLTGSLLLFNQLQQESYDILYLELLPGSVYYSGMILNYIDQKNFVLVSLNNHSKYTKKGSLTVTLVENQEASVLFEQQVENEFEGNQYLVAYATPEGLSILLNQEEVFQWEGVQFVQASTAGLYSQQNSDARFIQLSVGNQEDLEEVVETEEEMPPAEVEAEEEEINAQTLIKNIEYQDGFDSYLTIQEPYSASQVEFSEVFTVPLDRFYVSLFMNSSIVDAGMGEALEEDEVREVGKVVRAVTKAHDGPVYHADNRNGSYSIIQMLRKDQGDALSPFHKIKTTVYDEKLDVSYEKEVDLSDNVLKLLYPIPEQQCCFVAETYGDFELVAFGPNPVVKASQHIMGTDDYTQLLSSPNRDFFLVYHYTDSKLNLIDQNGTLIHGFTMEVKGLSRAALSPMGLFAILAQKNAKNTLDVRIVDCADDAVLAEWKDQGYLNLETTLFSPDGNTCVLNAGGGGKLFNLTVKKVVLTLSNTGSGSLCFLSNDQLAQKSYRTLTVWNTKTGASEHSYLHDESISKIYTYNAGHVLFLSKNSIFLLDVENGTTKELIATIPGEFKQFDIKKDGSQYLLQFGDKVSIYKSSDHSKVRDVTINTERYFFSDDGYKLYARESFGNMMVYDLVNNLLIDPTLNISNVRINAATANCDKLLLASQDYRKIYVWDATSKQVLYEKENVTGISAMGFTKNGQNIVQFSKRLFYYVEDITTGEKRYDIEHELMEDRSPIAAVSPDGSKILLTYRDNVMKVWDLNEKAYIKTINGRPENDATIKWIENSRWMVMALRGYPVGIYTTASSANPLWQMPAQSDASQSIAVSKDEKVLALMQNGSTSRVEFWSIQKQGRQKIEGNDFDTPATRGAFFDLNHNGDKVIIENDDRSVSVWDVNQQAEAFEIKTEGKILLARFTQDGQDLIVMTTMGIRKVVVEIGQEVEVTESEEKPYALFQRLDYRPKFWYRGIQEAMNREAYFKALSEKYKGIMDTLEARLQLNLPTDPLPDAEEIAKQHSLLRDQLIMLDEYKSLTDQSRLAQYASRDVAQEVVHSVRTNGYKLYYENNFGEVVIPDESAPFATGLASEITGKGYHFAILGERPKFKSYTPYRIPGFMDYHNQTAWVNFLENFRENLFDSGAIGPDKKSLFDAKSAELIKFESSPQLKDQLAEMLADKEEAIKQKAALATHSTQIEAEISAWKSDYDQLALVQNGYPSSGSLVDDYRWLYNELQRRAFSRLRLQHSAHSGKSVRTRRVTVRFAWFKVGTVTFHYTTIHNNMKVNQLHEGSRQKYLQLRYDYQAWVRPPYNTVNHRLNGGSSVYSFIQELRNLCDDFVKKSSNLKAEIERDIQKTENAVLFHDQAIKDLNKNGLAIARKRFVSFWNDPASFGARQILANAILPDSDPIADLMDQLRKDAQNADESDNFEIDVFEYSGNRYYNQGGLSMPAYLEYIKGSDKRRVAIFPVFRDDGMVDTNAYQSVQNPEPALSDEVRLPIIKFVETHQIRIHWRGYHLGELSHTENLFPNESKEITIEKKTQLTRKLEESRSSSQVTKMKTTSSFEDNLTNEFSLKDTSSTETSLESEDTSKSTSEHDSEVIDHKKNEFSLDVKMGGKGGLLTKVIGLGGEVGSKYKNESDVKKTDKRKNTFETSRTNKGKTANKESREAFTKDVRNTIKKVSTETSQENKVDIKISSSEEYTESNSRVEVLKVENPNMGRTVNYNFFQVQNVYEISTVLTDVKIVVDPNREVIKGSKTSDVRVYDLEEVGKIFADGDENDAQHQLTCAIVARQVFKNYLTGIPGIARGNGALRIEEPFVPNEDYFETLNFSKAVVNETGFEIKLLEALSNALTYLKKVPFRFQEVVLNEPSSYAINSGSYYLDSQVGKYPATEKYLEERRDIETELKRSEVKHLQTQTEEKVFFAPDGTSNGAE